jgi:tetratricopeptide (TPR) repeat protein
MDRFNRICAICIALITTAAAILSFLQFDASARDDRANRDNKRYSIEAFGGQVAGEARVNFDIYRVYQAYDEFQVRSVTAENNGNSKLASAYEQLAEATRKRSPLLGSKYFPPDADGPDIARYEVDTYFNDVTRLNQLFKASAAVKDAWDTKSNAYVVHLTLLAVSLFLFGLAVTLGGATTRTLFVSSGTVVGLAACIWALRVWAEPVYDLRDAGKAIEHYVLATGLSHQGDAASGDAAKKKLYTKALAEFDASLNDAPRYFDALVARAQNHRDLGDIASEAKDLEVARTLDEHNAGVLSSLAYSYFELNRLPEALSTSEAALREAPHEVANIYYNALYLLAADKTDAAKAEFARATQLVAEKIAQARANKEEPPSELLEAMYDASVELEDLGGKKHAELCEQLADELNSNEMGLEYSGVLPKGKPAAELTDLEFTETSEDGKDDKPVAEEFSDEVSQISVHFDYEKMRDGSNIIFRIYHNGEEERSWRSTEDWTYGAEGSFEQVLSPGYTDTFTFEPGDYLVEVYVDFHKVQYGSFTVKETR